MIAASYVSYCTIVDINYVDFLQFQRYFIPQAELEEAFIYIIRKPTIMEKINGQTPKNGVVFDTTSNVQPI